MPPTRPSASLRLLLIGLVFLALGAALLVSGGASSAASPPGRSVVPVLATGTAPMTASADHTPRKCAGAKRGQQCRSGTSRRNDPRYRRGLFVDSQMPAYVAGGVFRKQIGRRAQAFWLTDQLGSPRQVRAAVSGYTSRAVAASKTPILSVYAIPGRDCGLYSSGGLSSYAKYRKWATAAAQGMRGGRAIVIVEPDAVAFMGDSRCAAPRPRQKAIAYAVRQFARAGAWVYIDAGHSGWRDAKTMAGLLKRSGMPWARGFSTNLSNHRPTAEEQVYARQITRALAKVGLKGKKYVIETARNGADPAPSNGDFCNPTSARLGRVPKLIFRGALDGYLWVKNPGESDGECNGGPAAGVWWPEGAMSLMGR